MEKITAEQVRFETKNARLLFGSLSALYFALFSGVWLLAINLTRPAVAMGEQPTSVAFEFTLLLVLVSSLTVLVVAWFKFGKLPLSATI